MIGMGDKGTKTGSGVRWGMIVALSVFLLSSLEGSKAMAPGANDGRIATFSWRVSGPFGGEARRLAFDPSRPELCYLGSSDGLIYRSFNSGQSWQILRPGLGQVGFSIEAIVVDRKESTRLFVGGWNVRSGHGGGVFVSEDQGESWTALAGIQGHAIRALVQSPSHPDVLVAGALDGVFRSDDGGGSWRRISPLQHKELKNIEALALHPHDPDIIFAGTWHLPWKTSDGGKVWRLIGGRHLGMTDDSDIFSIVLDHRRPRTVYMGACTGVYRSKDGGQSWRKIRGIPSTSRRTLVIRQHPARHSILLAGTTQGLWRSTDRGLHWSLLTDRRLIVNDVAIQPPAPHAILLATNLGVFSSFDGGRSFSPSNNGFAHRRVSTLQLDAEKPARLYAGVLGAGLGSGLYISEDRGISWNEVGRSLKGVNVFCLYQVRGSPNDLYAGTNRGLYWSQDRGSTWAPLELHTSTLDLPAGGRSRPSKTQHEKVLALAPLQEPDTVLLLRPERLYEVHLKQRRSRVIYVARQGEKLLVPLISRTAPETYYLGTSRGLVISYDAGLTWASYSVNGSPVQAFCQTSTRSRNITFLGTSFGLFRLSEFDGQLKWTRCGGGLPPISVSAIIVNPNNEDEIIVGDRRHGALYSSFDGGVLWKRIDSGFSGARISALAFGRHSDSLYVGTSNRSTYVGLRTVEDLAVARKEVAADR